MHRQSHEDRDGDCIPKQAHEGSSEKHIGNLKSHFVMIMLNHIIPWLCYIENIIVTSTFPTLGFGEAESYTRSTPEENLMSFITHTERGTKLPSSKESHLSSKIDIIGR